MILTVDQQVAVNVVYRDADGNEARVDGDPVWTVADPTVAEFVPGATAFEGIVRALGPIGTTQVSVRADADLGDGVRELIGTLDIETVAGEAVVANVQAGQPEAQPEPAPAPTDPTTPAA